MKYLLSLFMFVIVSVLSATTPDTHRIGMEYQCRLSLPVPSQLEMKVQQGEQPVWVNAWLDSSSQNLSIRYTILDSGVYDLRDFLELTPSLPSPLWISAVHHIDLNAPLQLDTVLDPWKQKFFTAPISYRSILWILGILWVLALPTWGLYSWARRPPKIKPPPAAPVISALEQLENAFYELQTHFDEPHKVHFLMMYLAAFAEARQLPEMRVESVIANLHRDPAWGVLYAAIEYAFFENEVAPFPFDAVATHIENEKAGRARS